MASLLMRPPARTIAAWAVGSILATTSAVWGQTPATKVFVDRDLPLSEIFLEWRGKGLEGDMFICSCDRPRCDTNPYWPFRVFRVGQSIPVLGDFNRNIARSNGFICGIRPR